MKSYIVFTKARALQISASDSSVYLKALREGKRCGKIFFESYYDTTRITTAQSLYIYNIYIIYVRFKYLTPCFTSRVACVMY